MIFLIGIGLVVYFNFKQSPGKESQIADDILVQRYVNGEIDDHEYKVMLEVLKRK